jgi:hypothetical protein
MIMMMILLDPYLTPLNVLQSIKVCNNGMMAPYNVTETRMTVRFHKVIDRHRTRKIKIQLNLWNICYHLVQQV